MKKNKEENTVTETEQDVKEEEEPELYETLPEVLYTVVKHIILSGLTLYFFNHIFKIYAGTLKGWVNSFGVKENEENRPLDEI